MASLKGNVVLNGINTVTSILFPIITFPYAARVLLPEGIGSINFLQSIINYIVLLTSLGIPLYAVKEIAKHRDNIEERNKLTIEILILSILLCFLGYIIVLILSICIKKINSQISTFYILSLTILFTSLGVNWFYQAIEDFKFITVRAIIIRTLSAVSLFVFVHNAKDLNIYAIILVGSTVGNNLINFVHLRKYISINKFKYDAKNIVKHIKPAAHVFILNIIISLYVQINTIMLGFMTSDEYVGYLTAGTKLSTIGETLIYSISTVLLPRCSNLIQNNELQKFRLIINKSLRLIQLISYPIIVGGIALAYPIIMVFCGPEYEYSIKILYIHIPVVYFVCLTNLMGIQILYPLNKINLVIASVSVGAILNIVLNFFLIPKFQAIGSAITILLCELSVMIITYIIGSRYIPFKFSNIINIKYLSLSLLMGIIVYFISVNLDFNIYLNLFVSLLLGIMLYVSGLIVFKDPFINEINSQVKKLFIKIKL